VKVNPLVAWSAADVWSFIRAHDMPYNPLHDRGYPSIGCWPCTTAMAEEKTRAPGVMARAREDRMCGLHARSRDGRRDFAGVVAVLRHPKEPDRRAERPRADVQRARHPAGAPRRSPRRPSRRRMMAAAPELFPVFLKLAGRRVLVVGAGPVAASKIQGLLSAGADVTVVAPDMHTDIERAAVTRVRRPFAPGDLEGAWLVVAAATPDVNREVARAAEAKSLFVNAVDDPPNATAYLGGIVRRGDVTFAISTGGRAPALAGPAARGARRRHPGGPRAVDGRSSGDPAAMDRRRRADGGAAPPTARGARRAVRAACRRPKAASTANRRTAAVVPVALAARTVRSTTALALRDGGLAVTAPGWSRETGAGPRVAGTTAGFVSLVGAGPGDPELLTRRAHQRLREADLVLYDALVPAAMLDLAPQAQRFFVGKRAGRAAIAQDTINRLLVRAARRGRRVVRLKAGDPFVFGRGGEEALALARRACGGRSCPASRRRLAAPALAGIP
jgi:uroporphyrin-III C-methyltransferase / precorrin-2 dehydrogenase / sirohydrochlorin ferrochelatase